MSDELLLISSHDWPVSDAIFVQPEHDPMLDGLEPVRPEDPDPETRLALEEFQRDRAAQADPEFKAIVVLRDPVDEGEVPR